MRRTFLKNRIIFIITALILVVLIPLTAMRIKKAKKYFEPKAIAEFTGNFGTVTDKFEQPIYEKGKNINKKLFETTVGVYDSTSNHYTVANSIIAKYEDELINTKFKTGENFHETIKVGGIIQTTLLPENIQNKIVDIYGNHSGSVTAYNYKTGEIYMLLSVNSENQFNNEAMGCVTPGSTMKAITSIVAYEQGIDLNKLKFTCKGKYTLPDGIAIECMDYAAHGTINFKSAYQKSCNCWFAQAICTFDVEKTIEVMKKLGFNVNGTGDDVRAYDRLTFANSTNKTTTTATYNDVWGYVGQINTKVNPLGMAQLFGAIMNEGKSAEPYIVSKILNKTDNDKVAYEHGKVKNNEYLSKGNAKTLEKTIKKATKDGYSANLDSRIVAVKTGTAQEQKGDKRQTNRLLVGATEDGIAFYININNTTSGDKRTFTIANTLVSHISINKSNNG